MKRVSILLFSFVFLAFAGSAIPQAQTALRRPCGHAWCGHMLTLARFSGGRIVLHLAALLGDGAVRFHAAGIARELRTWVRY
jgi:hypothetical protein